MDFGLSEEQELLQATVRQFVERECPPAKLREHFESAEDRSLVLWRGLAELGVAGLVVPEAHGGAGSGSSTSRSWPRCSATARVPGPFLGHSLARLALALGGSPEQQRRWLPRLAAGERLGSVALAEAEDGGWQPEEWTAKADGDGLRCQSLGARRASSADLLVVGVAGGGLALVERGAAGVTVEPSRARTARGASARLALDGAPCELLPGGAAAAPRRARRRRSCCSPPTPSAAPRAASS